MFARVVVMITSHSLISDMSDENIVDIIEREKNNIRMNITTTLICKYMCVYNNV